MNIENEIILLKARVTALGKLLDSIQKGRTIELTNEQMDDAKFMALQSMVRELAEERGVSEESFVKHFEKRFRYWHDVYLRRAEDVSPAIAAEIDVRSPHELLEQEPDTSIFDPL